MDATKPNRRKRKRPSFPKVCAEFERKLLENVLPRIKNSGDTFAAIGIDMAAQERKWGVSVLTTKDEMSKGTLRLLLPHSFEIDGFGRKYPMKPSGALLSRLFAGLMECKVTTAVAVDVPFGWPLEHKAFLETWSALGSVLPAGEELPLRKRFEYRLCDLTLMECLGEQDCSTSIFPVGADKIASAAFEWAKLRHTVLGRFGSVDLGYLANPAHGGVTFIETYPSAFVRLNYPSCTEYKTGKLDQREGADGQKKAKKASKEKARFMLMERLVREYQLVHDGTEECAKAACSTSASDPIDGFLSAIAAWDYLKWSCVKPSLLRISSPLTLLGPERAAEERDRVNKEGWILVRLPDSCDPKPAVECDRGSTQRTGLDSMAQGKRMLP